MAKVYKGETIISVINQFQDDARTRYFSKAKLECETCHKPLVVTKLRDEGSAEYYTRFIFTCPNKRWFKLGHRTKEGLGLPFVKPSWSS